LENPDAGKLLNSKGKQKTRQELEEAGRGEHRQTFIKHNSSAIKSPIPISFKIKLKIETNKTRVNFMGGFHDLGLCLPKVPTLEWPWPIRWLESELLRMIMNVDVINGKCE